MFRQILWITVIFILLTSTFAQAKIVFTSAHGGASEIYVMNDDGSRVKRLTHNKFGERNPTWSPDGKQIAFTRTSNAGFGNSQYDIFIMDADGRNQRNLTKHPARDNDASWSPDGRHIAFTSSRSGRNEIHIIDIFSGEVKRLTHSKVNNAFGIKGIGVDGFLVDGYSHEPCWSPDGKYIVYNPVAIRQDGTINVIDVKTKQTKQLFQLKPHISVNRPRWSPNGKYILYHETNSEEAAANVNPNEPNFRDDFFRLLKSRFVIVSVDGFEQPELAIPEEWSIDFKTSWSPDSKEFVFSASPKRRGGSRDIYRYNLVTHEIMNLTNNVDYDIAPNWFNRTLSVNPTGKVTTQWGEMKQ